MLPKDCMSLREVTEQAWRNCLAKNALGNREYTELLLQPYPGRWISIPAEDFVPPTNERHGVLIAFMASGKIHFSNGHEMRMSRTEPPKLWEQVRASYSTLDPDDLHQIIWN